MAAQNVEYASGDSALESLLLACLPDFGEHGDGILNSNVLSAFLKMKDCYDEIEGGLEFWYGIDKAENSNFKTQGKNDDMSVNAQDPKARLRWEPKILTGSVVINSLDKARNRGRAAIRQWVKDNTETADKTAKNKFNSLLWASSPGSDDPDSIPNIVTTTPGAGTVGGLSRAGNTYLQNRAYTTAIADIGSEAGIAAMVRLCVEQSVGTSTPDLFILDSTNFGGLIGYLSTQQRWRPVEELMKLNIKTIDLGAFTVGYENLQVLGGANTITSGYMYGLNSQFCKIKRLMGETKDGWGTQFERIGTKLNKAVFFEWFYNLTTNCPRAHLVATNVSTT